jgi:hypothetical protein
LIPIAGLFWSEGLFLLLRHRCFHHYYLKMMSLSLKMNFYSMRKTMKMNC